MTTPGQQLTPGDDQNPPTFGVPEGAYVGDAGSPNAIHDLNNLTEAEAKNRMLGQVAPSFERQRDGVWQNGGLLSHIADFLFGSGPGAPATRLSDGMTELNNRLDLMEDVSGYGGMIMSNNHRFSGSEHKVIPFNTQYGPNTPSVSLDTTNHRIYLARGTWSINLLLATPQAGAIGGGDTWMRPAIRVYRPDGSEYLTQWLDWRSGVRPHAYYAQIPLIVPNDDGFYVEALFRQDSLNFRILGGTDRSKFWVNRWDLRTDENNIIIDPPDGPDV